MIRKLRQAGDQNIAAGIHEFFRGTEAAQDAAGRRSGGFSGLNIHQAVADHNRFFRRRSAEFHGFEKSFRRGFSLTHGVCAQNN